MVGHEAYCFNRDLTKETTLQTPHSLDKEDVYSEPSVHDGETFERILKKNYASSDSIELSERISRPVLFL